MGVQRSVWVPDLNSFGYTTKSGIFQSHGSSVSVFETAMFSTEAVLFYIPTSNSQGFLFLHILSYTCYFYIVFVFIKTNFVIAFLMELKWYSLVVLIWIYLMISDVEHLLKCLLGICIYLEKYLFKVFAYFSVRLFVFPLFLNCGRSFYILSWWLRQ